jgi:hypothetical protein
MRTIDILYQWSGKVLNMHAVTYESDGIEEGASSKECSLAEPFGSSSVIHQNLHAKGSKKLAQPSATAGRTTRSTCVGRPGRLVVPLWRITVLPRWTACIHLSTSCSAYNASRWPMNIFVIVSTTPVSTSTVATLTATSRVAISCQERVFHLPNSHFAADTEFEIFLGDTVPVFVHHHNTQQDAKLEEEETIDIVFDCITDHVAESKQDHLANGKESGAEKDVADGPSIIESPYHKDQLQYNVDDHAYSRPDEIYDPEYDWFRG